MSTEGSAAPPPAPKGNASATSPPIHASRSHRIWAPSYKLDKLPKLTGPNDYQKWRETTEHVLTIFNCWNIVTGEEELPEEEHNSDGDITNSDDIDGYRDRYQYASAYFLETVDPTWITILTTHKTPSAIWKAFQDKFARENTVSFYNQFSSLLNFKLNNKDDIADHLMNFDTLWNRLQYRCSTANDMDSFKLPYAFQNVFNSLEAKAALLLYTLPESMSNIVDNLQTNPDLTYDQAYNKLMDLSTSVKADEDKAYMTNEKNKGKGKSSSKPQTNSKECTYCRKHYPTSRYTGHSWNECKRLKSDQEKRKD